MIPLELQDSLIERFVKELKHLRLKNLKNELVPVNIFTQHLPNKSKERDDDPYPCIIIRLADGSLDEVNEGGGATVQFIIGIVDRESSNQGYRDTVMVSNRISESLIRNPLIDKRYELELPINWVYHDEDSEPYYFAGLETNWTVPKHLREDVEDMI